MKINNLSADGRLGRSAGLGDSSVPRIGEICAIMKLAMELKDCGAFSTLSARELAERTGYRKSDLVNLMRKYSDIFMSVPVSGGYKLKNFSELNGDIERILRMLIWKRVWFLVAAVCAPLFLILITIVLVVANAD